MDLDGDGRLDILSGSWPGELFWFRSGEGGTFAAPEMLKDEDDQYINIGGGIRETDEEILITGHAEFETVDGASVAVYHGKRIASKPGKGLAITGTASSVHACDWDGDGDLDLLVGDIRGRVYLVPNLGTRKAWSFGKERQLTVGGRALAVEGDAGPFAADWDGDGDLDLLVGSGDGSVSLFANTGSRTAPQLAKAEQLVAPGPRWDQVPAEPRCGARTKVCVADWNGDGQPDLLVGDYARQKPELPPFTEEQQKEHGRLRAELDGLQTRYGEMVQKLYGSPREKDEKRRGELQQELDRVRTSMQEIQAKVPPEAESHGWVWLLLRRTGDR